ncbi:RecA protein [Thecamonas trahens ATCC 50062]|uniref:RecA protein n=1 Tax=Thecamonas trahens ATCC 50062 TaxID=461836 RepID=A0A0L0DU68_THETB|nr:RecA protein [Thecamonas trahens ATCC 50062]KNC55737.1 RecA protein [Thecamonas trahens ATCC 50062]|eukprot:XP_013752890.1 RecA protein [Thecamonas trahens ATCC 50062]
MLTAARAVCVSMRRAVAPLLPAVVPMAVPLRGLVTTPPVAARKRKAAGRPGSLEEAIKMVELSCGKGSLTKLGAAAAETAPIDVIPTGSLTLDAALGVGGLPRGRVVEIYGPESSGKTTLALSVVAEAQKMGGTCTFVDAEHALDVAYASALGVDTAELYVSQPDSGEQALEIVDTLAKSGAMDVIVVDSVAALVPRAELEGEMGDAHVGLQARLMSQALRKLTATLANSSTLLIFINQLRMKIGVLFGSPEVTAGGVGLKFYASVRLDIRRTGSIKVGNDLVGNTTRVKVVKNKVAPPFKEAHFDIEFGRGIGRVGEIIDLSVNHGLVERAGAWYTYPRPGDDEPVRLGQGRENVKAYLEDHPELVDELHTALRAVMIHPAAAPTPATDTPTAVGSEADA